MYIYIDLTHKRIGREIGTLRWFVHTKDVISSIPFSRDVYTKLGEKGEVDALVCPPRIGVLAERVETITKCAKTNRFREGK